MNAQPIEERFESWLAKSMASNTARVYASNACYFVESGLSLLDYVAQLEAAGLPRGTSRVRAAAAAAWDKFQRGESSARTDREKRKPAPELLGVFSSMDYRMRCYLAFKGIFDRCHQDDILQDAALDLMEYPPPDTVTHESAVFIRVRSAYWRHVESRQKYRSAAEGVGRSDGARTAVNPGFARVMVREAFSSMKGGLNEGERECLLLAALGASREEISEALAIPQSKVARWLQSARRRMATWLKTGAMPSRPSRPLATLEAVWPD